MNLLVISTSRSEFGQLAPLAREAVAQGHRARVVVTGMHHDSRTPTEAEAKGLDLVRLPRPQDSLGLVHQVALRDLIAADRPDVIVILGDRFELFELLVPVVLADVPVAHLSGGERTAGAIDDLVRNAVSQVAHLHYPAHEAAGARLQELGVDGWRVCVAGEPGLDAIRSEPRPTDLVPFLGVQPQSGDVLVALHPVTRDPAQTEACLDAIAAVATGRWFVSSPNGDPGSERIRARLQGGPFIPFANHGAAVFRAVAAACGTVIGNSSAGLVEAPNLGCATIDLGTRQQGRPRGGSIITVEAPSPASLREALARVPQARERARPELNPYGDGHTCARIVRHLATLLPDLRLKQR